MTLRRSFWGSVFLMVAFCSMGSTYVRAAEIVRVELPRANKNDLQKYRLELEGEIKPGDSEKITKLSNSESVEEIWLSSLGGDYAEGLKIALTLKSAGIATIVKSGNVCLSACALSFLGGRGPHEDDFQQKLRTIEPKAIVGFHAPFPILPDRDYTRENMDQAFSAAVQVVADFITKADELGVPLKFVPLLLKPSKNEFYKIESVDQLQMFEFRTVEPTAPRFLTQVMALNACANAYSKYQEKSADSAVKEADGAWEQVLSNSDRSSATERFITRRTVKDGKVVPDHLTTIFPIAYGPEGTTEWCVLEHGYENGKLSNVSGSIASPDFDTVSQLFDETRNSRKALSTIPFAYLAAPNTRIELIDQYLRDESSGKPLLAVPANGNRPGVPTVSAKPKIKYQYYSGRDADGGDIEKHVSISPSQCEEKCDANSACVGFSFDRWNRYCFIKSTLRALRREPRSVTATKPNVGLGTSQNPMIFQKRKGKSFPDRPYGEVLAIDFDDCSRRCMSDDRCEAINFSLASRRCQAIANPSEYQDSASSDIGIKSQRP